MDGMREREYSSHSGLSRGAIQKARKAGRLVVFGDGSINAAASDVRRGDMTDPDQQHRSTGGDSGFCGPADSSSYLKARTALTVYQAQKRQLAIQKNKGALVDRARAEALVFRLARQERDVWVTWPARVAALMATQVTAGVKKQSGRPAVIQTAILQRTLRSWPPCGSELPNRSGGGRYCTRCLDMLLTISGPHYCNGLVSVGRVVIVQEGFAVSMAFPAIQASDPS